MGNSIGSTAFRDKMDDTDADGGLLVQYDALMAFLKGISKTFRSSLTLIRWDSWKYRWVRCQRSAQMHFCIAPTAVMPLSDFSFWIIASKFTAQGVLPSGLQVEDVMMGTSLPRNKMIFTHGAYLLPYTGVGSGFIRVRELDDEIELLNDENRQEVIVTFLAQR